MEILLLSKTAKFPFLTCDRIYGRCIAKEAMKKAIQEVMKEKLIDNEEPIPAFYCMCSDGKDHVARVEDNVFIICNKTAENQDGSINRS